MEGESLLNHGKTVSVVFPCNKTRKALVPGNTILWQADII